MFARLGANKSSFSASQIVSLSNKTSPIVPSFRLADGDVFLEWNFIIIIHPPARL